MIETTTEMKYNPLRASSTSRLCVIIHWLEANQRRLPGRGIELSRWSCRSWEKRRSRASRAEIQRKGAASSVLGTRTTLGWPRM